MTVSSANYLASAQYQSMLSCLTTCYGAPYARVEQQEAYATPKRGMFIRPKQPLRGYKKMKAKREPSFPNYYYDCLDHLQNGNAEPMRQYVITLMSTCHRVRTQAKTTNQKWVNNMVAYYSRILNACQKQLEYHCS